MLFFLFTGVLKDLMMSSEDDSPLRAVKFGNVEFTHIDELDWSLKIRQGNYDVDGFPIVLAWTR